VQVFCEFFVNFFAQSRFELETGWNLWWNPLMKAKPVTSLRTNLPQLTRAQVLPRRSFLRQSLAVAGGCAICLPGITSGAEQSPAKPVGVAKGIKPGRVVWAYDPEVTDWKGQDDGHWWQGQHVKQARVDAMMARTVCELTGETKVPAAWDKLFRHLNQARGKGDVGYKAGEQILIKPNWVGMIWHENRVNPDTYEFMSGSSNRPDYMNTGPQMILALLNQLASAGVAPKDVTICDTLAYLVRDYYEILHGSYSAVRYEDYAGKLDRIQVKASSQPLYWSSRPAVKMPDNLPTCFADAQYLINFAALKAHTMAGVTLCAKNHFGSLIRWPGQQGYFNTHSTFSRDAGTYRCLVDLTGHAHLGGKTVLYLVDGLFSGVHPTDPVPQKLKAPPFNGKYSCSLLASQDPVAIDSVGIDFLAPEFPTIAARPGVDDYLREAALANDPPSGTFYDPDHATPTTRLASLGAYEHWNNPTEKKYSRNLGTGEGIELVSVKLGSA
jgi:hypothetical protein